MNKFRRSLKGRRNIMSGMISFCSKSRWSWLRSFSLLVSISFWIVTDRIIAGMGTNLVNYCWLLTDVDEPWKPEVDLGIFEGSFSWISLYNVISPFPLLPHRYASKRPSAKPNTPTWALGHCFSCTLYFVRSTLYEDHFTATFVFHVTID